MSDLLVQRESFEPIEALVRAAGGYVLPSDDLRPRVLETARAVRGERRALARIGQFARWLLILAIFIEALGDQLQEHLPAASARQANLDSDALFSAAQQRVSRDGVEMGWGLVEAYCELRGRQARSLRGAL